MKNPGTVFALALALGVGGAAVTTSLMMGPPLVQPETESGFSEGPVGRPALVMDEDALLDRLQLLREENANLRDRVIALEQISNQDLRKPAGSPVTRAEFEAFKREVRAFLDGRVALEPESKEFKSRVADLMESIRKEEAVEKFKEMQAKDSERLEERVQQWDEWLGFNEYQRSEFRLLLSTRDMQDAEVLRLWSEGADDETIGQAKRSNEEQYQTAISALLTPQQLATFRERYSQGK
ncbi:MAG: hypothetical protein ACYTG5_06215 [Planctomycetota bacterium]|jgi:hypothetical protein